MNIQVLYGVETSTSNSSLKKARCKSSLWLDVKGFLKCKILFNAFQENWKRKSENVFNVKLGQQISSNIENKQESSHA